MSVQHKQLCHFSLDFKTIFILKNTDVWLHKHTQLCHFSIYKKIPVVLKNKSLCQSRSTDKGPAMCGLEKKTWHSQIFI